MMGMTLACARCHDHKYDPIPRRDYYRIMCAFNGGDRAEVPLAPLEEVRRYREAQAKWKAEFDPVKSQRDQFQEETRKKYKTASRHARIDALKIGDEEKALLKNDPDSKGAKDLAKKFSKDLEVGDKDYLALASDAERSQWDERQKAYEAVEARKPKELPTALAFADFSPQPRETFLLTRGDFRAKSEPVELGFLTAATRGKPPADFWTAARNGSRRTDSTQQRRAMTDLDHGAGPLVARVIVNRVWQHHFGEGLVRTVNDFGVRCDPPTHPELLEWLASEFVKGGWKLKPLHRLIMNSSTYAQRSDVPTLPLGNERRARSPARAPTLQRSNTPLSIDPDNRLLWRRRPQRIESEILRDSILVVSGALNPEMFGPAYKSPIAPEAIQARNMTDPYPADLQDTEATRRRSVYMFHKRVVQQPLMQAFDGPDAQASCGRRVTTTVAPQALALLNDRFIRARAEDLARRLEKDAGDATPAQVQRAWRLVLSRDPTVGELNSSTTFIDAQFAQRSARGEKEKTDARHRALTDFCQALFALNEFIYVD
jgi:hypothetical protein